MSTFLSLVGVAVVLVLASAAMGLVLGFAITLKSAREILRAFHVLGIDVDEVCKYDPVGERHLVRLLVEEKFDQQQRLAIHRLAVWAEKVAIAISARDRDFLRRTRAAALGQGPERVHLTAVIHRKKPGPWDAWDVALAFHRADAPRVFTGFTIPNVPPQMAHELLELRWARGRLSRI